MRSSDILTSTVLTPVWPCKTEAWFFIDDSFRTPLTIYATVCDTFMEIDVSQQTIVWKRIWDLSSRVLNCFFGKQHLLNIDFVCTVENMSFSSSVCFSFHSSDLLQMSAVPLIHPWLAQVILKVWVQLGVFGVSQVRVLALVDHFNQWNSLWES